MRVTPTVWATVAAGDSLGSSCAAARPASENPRARTAISGLHRSFFAKGDPPSCGSRHSQSMTPAYRVPIAGRFSGTRPRGFLGR